MRLGVVVVMARGTLSARADRGPVQFAWSARVHRSPCGRARLAQPECRDGQYRRYRLLRHATRRRFRSHRFDRDVRAYEELRTAVGEARPLDARRCEAVCAYL